MKFCSAGEWLVYLIESTPWQLGGELVFYPATNDVSQQDSQPCIQMPHGLWWGREERDGEEEKSRTPG